SRADEAYCALESLGDASQLRAEPGIPARERLHADHEQVVALTSLPRDGVFGRLDALTGNEVDLGGCLALDGFRLSADGRLLHGVANLLKVPDCGEIRGLSVGRKRRDGNAPRRRDEAHEIGGEPRARALVCREEHPLQARYEAALLELGALEQLALVIPDRNAGERP